MAAGYNPAGAGSTTTPTTVANQPTNYNVLGALELSNARGVVKPDVGDN